MVRILFVCNDNSARSQMAEAFARAAAPEDATVNSAGIAAAEMHPLTGRVMAEVGISMDECRAKRLSELDTQECDIVVTLCGAAAAECPQLPGYPTRVDWNLADPTALHGSDEDLLLEFRRCRDEIRRLVEDFFRRGYFAALVDAKRRGDLILDNISDGIIAHDTARRIFYLNRAAERITGYSREDMLNSDCHQVFPGSLCGGKCRFCDSDSPDYSPRADDQQIVTRSGERCDVSLLSRALLDASGTHVGQFITFSDRTTERRLARRVGEIEKFAGIVGRDEKMLEIFDLIRDLAESNVPVLIQGESGTGKELIAAAIHNEGLRANKLFVPVNCGALPESLLESELFGHVRGAFTGAIRDKKGRFELADGGTIFLDEIGDVSPAMQVRLLRVLQEGCFERVGSEETQRVSVRVISATNKDLQEELQEGRFREDLFYRLNVVPIFLPPLRERRNDIPLLVDEVLRRAVEEIGREGVALSDEALDVMMSHDWPGNVRELQNWIQFSLVRCRQGKILPEHLPPPHAAIVARPTKKRRQRKLTIETVRAALREAGGSKVAAAKRLDVSRATLYRFLDDMDMMT